MKKARKSSFRGRSLVDRGVSKTKLFKRISNIQRIIEDKDFEEASFLLNELIDEVADNEMAYALLGEVSYELQDAEGTIRAGEGMMRLLPKEPFSWVTLAVGYILSERPANGLKLLQVVIDKWPGFADADEVRRMAMEIREDLCAELKTTEFEIAGELLDSVCAVETGRFHLSDDRLEEAEAGAVYALERQPKLACAVELMANVLFMKGEVRRSIEMLEDGLTGSPDDGQFLCHLVHYCAVIGDISSARKHTDRLKEISLVEGTIAKNRHIIALGFIGANQELVDSVSEDTLDYENSLVSHLYAVALSRTGNEEKAVRVWQELRGFDPEFSLATDNLADQEKGVGWRNGPWEFPSSVWMPMAWLNQFFEEVSGGEDGILNMREFMEKRPEINVIMDLFLERGDNESRELAIWFAGASKSGTLIESVRRFAAGSIGTDACRLLAALVVARERAVAGEIFRFNIYIEGRLREVALPCCIISDDTNETKSISEEFGKVNRHIKLGQVDQAEQELKILSSRSVGPASIEITVKNLARCGSACCLIARGDYPQARETLQPLFCERSMTTSELRVFLESLFVLEKVTGGFDAAQPYLHILGHIDPCSDLLSGWFDRSGGVGAEGVM